MDRDCKSWRVILRTYSEDNTISVSDTINFNREVTGAKYAHDKSKMESYSMLAFQRYHY